ncbi:hypothetical protein [Sulfitobacter sp.]|uniref:hypothetical protein n=1 Tax=Sulfitobacter sp. TaxID=1903071 RepID=UPI0032972C96
MTEQDFDKQAETPPARVSANQSTGVTTFGRPHCAAVAATEQAKHAAYRAEQAEYAAATAKAKALAAQEAEEKAARTREATRANLFWNNVQNPEPEAEQGEQE